MTDAKTLATRLGCSIDAVELCRGADVVDLHLDTFIWSRIVGYDVFARHDGGPFGRRFGGHVDVPRLADGGVTAGMWSITTNPFRSAAAPLGGLPGEPADPARAHRRLVGRARRGADARRTIARPARAGAHACFLAIQGCTRSKPRPRASRPSPTTACCARRSST
jgi:hypothetical protein